MCDNGQGSIGGMHPQRIHLKTNAIQSVGPRLIGNVSTIPICTKEPFERERNVQRF